jgi:hypothetical protein
MYKYTMSVHYSVERYITREQVFEGNNAALTWFQASRDEAIRNVFQESKEKIDPHSVYAELTVLDEQEKPWEVEDTYYPEGSPLANIAARDLVLRLSSIQEFDLSSRSEQLLRYFHSEAKRLLNEE